MNGKIITMLIFFFNLLVTTYSQPIMDMEETEGIKFLKGSFEKALELAKEEDKPVYLEIYTTWCYYCKKLKRKTHTDTEVGQFLNKNFINIRLDAEKGEGIEIAEVFDVRAYPTLLIIDPSGIVIGYHEGYLKPKKFLAFGKNASTKLKRK